LTRFSLSTTISASVADVWQHLSDLSSHTRWMSDAVTITFVTDTTSGVGAVMDCKVPVGFLSITDRMRVTEWTVGEAITVSHEGAVRGIGRFRIVAANGRTRLDWNEALTFPWWLGGPIGGWLSRPLLQRRFRTDLAAFTALVERESQTERRN
jgi:carbon monoxide dehydrogenase subunit G